jgi:metallo-beta-lactamase family protein
MKWIKEYETMKLSFHGAAREVTGSCYQLEINDKKVIIDCGMQQGHDEKNNQTLPFESKAIDTVLLTHAHIDHSGRLPLMVKNGFDGKIYTTQKTCELITIMLRDSAHIQEMDAQWENKKGKRAGKDVAVPLYTMEDVEETLKHLVPCNYEEDVTPLDGVTVRFTDAGHLLGSASIQVRMTENGITKKIVFSGDIGNIGQPIIRDPQYITESDYVVMESTYGDRDHEHTGDYVEDLAAIIDETLGKGGNVIIPSFAVGRTQELLYFIREIKERKLVKSLPAFPVYVDSPLASLATKIFDGDLRGYADEETVEVIRNGFRPLDFEGLNITESTDESKMLNEDRLPKIIISSSGMCDAGRIRHHLKHNLWRPECAIVFVGYQAGGTLGRMLLEGIQKVKLFGEEIVVAAKIVNFRGLSAHADRTGLLKWIHSYTKKPQKVFVIHGDTAVCDFFADSLVKEGYQAMAPNFETVYDLAKDIVINEGIRVETLQTEAIRIKTAHDQTNGMVAVNRMNTGRTDVHTHFDQGKTVSYAYSRLLDAGVQLLAVIKQNENGQNRNLAKFTEQIIALVQKWDR